MVPSFYIPCIVLKISEIQEKTGVVELTLSVQSCNIFCRVEQSGKAF